jgi:two-component system LytT family response regulator
MEKIRSIIVDDELSNRLVLKNLLNRYCPSVEVITEAKSAEEGFQLINEHKPEVVFLDVKMPVQSGFDMLRMFSEIDFRIVFVTAHDEFAIQAFEFSAMDYLLKPIDYTKLVRAVEKVESNIRMNLANDTIHFVRSIDQENKFLKSFSFHSKDKVTLVDIHQICFIQASRNYCDVITVNNEKYTSPKTLAEYEQMLSEFPNFLRINKGVIININYMLEYSKGAVCFITMTNSKDEMEVSRRKKGEILHYLKEHQS